MQPADVSSPDGDETNFRPDETIFGAREDIRKPAPGSN
jgi:hypothetical protein